LSAGDKIGYASSKELDMRTVVALLLSAAMLFALGCVEPHPPLGLDRLDAVPRDLPPVDEATAKLFEPVDGMAVVYIYRPSRVFGGGSIMSVVINDKYIAPMKNGSFLRIVLPSGKYIVRGGHIYLFGEREINVEAGQIYYLIKSIGAVGRGTATIALFPVAPSEAKGEILKLQMTDNPYNR
jgi:hypothetical protein